jgi:phosphoribosylformimino-5-aminoimidazole carboxamide ribotide isomerase
MDVRDGRVAVEGWSRTTDLSALEMAARIKDLPLAALIFTDIASDGMLQGPNWRSLTEMRSAYPGPLIASGGITAESDIRRLAELRFDGAIVGRAFYEGTLTLHQALAAANPSTLKDTVP